MHLALVILEIVVKVAEDQNQKGTRSKKTKYVYLLLVFPDPDGGRPGDDHPLPPLPLVPGEVATHLGVAGRHLEIIVTLNQ